MLLSFLEASKLCAEWSMVIADAKEERLGSRAIYSEATDSSSTSTRAILRRRFKVKPPTPSIEYSGNTHSSPNPSLLSFHVFNVPKVPFLVAFYLPSSSSRHNKIRLSRALPRILKPIHAFEHTFHGIGMRALLALH
jgi:hypothetical protein